jgi:hypothetical protein
LCHWYIDHLQHEDPGHFVVRCANGPPLYEFLSAYGNIDANGNKQETFIVAEYCLGCNGCNNLSLGTKSKCLGT